MLLFSLFLRWLWLRAGYFNIGLAQKWVIFLIRLACPTADDCREKLRNRRSKLTKEAEEEQRALEKFREQKMESTLDYNVKLADLQKTYASLAAKYEGFFNFRRRP